MAVACLSYDPGYNGVHPLILFGCIQGFHLPQLLLKAVIQCLKLLLTGGLLFLTKLVQRLLGLGLILGLATLLIWRRMEGKAPVRFTGKALGAAALGITGALTLGVGMCFCMVWGNMVLGIGIGLMGMILLLCLIPVTKGVHS